MAGADESGGRRNAGGTAPSGNKLWPEPATPRNPQTAPTVAPSGTSCVFRGLVKRQLEPIGGVGSGGDASARGYAHQPNQSTPAASTSTDQEASTAPRPRDRCAASCSATAASAATT